MTWRKPTNATVTGREPAGRFPSHQNCSRSANFVSEAVITPRRSFSIPRPLLSARPGAQYKKLRARSGSFSPALTPTLPQPTPSTSFQNAFQRCFHRRRRSGCSCHRLAFGKLTPIATGCLALTMLCRWPGRTRRAATALCNAVNRFSRCVAKLSDGVYFLNIHFSDHQLSRCYPRWSPRCRGPAHGLSGLPLQHHQPSWTWREHLCSADRLLHW